MDLLGSDFSHSRDPIFSDPRDPMIIFRLFNDTNNKTEILPVCLAVWYDEETLRIQSNCYRQMSKKMYRCISVLHSLKKPKS